MEKYTHHRRGEGTLLLQHGRLQAQAPAPDRFPRHARLLFCCLATLLVLVSLKSAQIKDYSQYLHRPAHPPVLEDSSFDWYKASIISSAWEDLRKNDPLYIKICMPCHDFVLTTLIAEMTARCPSMTSTITHPTIDGVGEVKACAVGMCLYLLCYSTLIASIKRPLTFSTGTNQATSRLLALLRISSMCSIRATIGLLEWYNQFNYQPCRHQAARPCPGNRSTIQRRDYYQPGRTRRLWSLVHRRSRSSIAICR